MNIAIISEKLLDNFNIKYTLRKKVNDLLKKNDFKTAANIVVMSLYSL